MTSATYAYVPKPRSKAWVDRIGSLLRDGYGSEDIAILLNSHPDQVRKQVQLFRESGLLAKWWPHA